VVFIIKGEGDEWLEEYIRGKSNYDDPTGRIHPRIERPTSPTRPRTTAIIRRTPEFRSDIPRNETP
jgi:hypothetical protein